MTLPGDWQQPSAACDKWGGGRGGGRGRNCLDGSLTKVISQREINNLTKKRQKKWSEKFQRKSTHESTSKSYIDNGKINVLAKKAEYRFFFNMCNGNFFFLRSVVGKGC